MSDTFIDIVASRSSGKTNSPAGEFEHTNRDDLLQHENPNGYDPLKRQENEYPFRISFEN
jgi:hypothetical protein